MNELYVIGKIVIVAGVIFYFLFFRKSSKKGRQEKKLSSVKEMVKKPFIPAKRVVVDNINRIIPLLDMLVKGEMDKQRWEALIVDLDNQQLTTYWEKIGNNPSAWLNILASFGIKHETCTSFIGSETYRKLYESDNNRPIEVGANYVVVSPCWLLTYEDKKGYARKKLLKKGIVNKYVL